MKDGRRKTEDGKLDLAIDAAVREMLDVEPPADLRARVMAQVEASGSRLPAAGFRLPASGWVLGPVAAAAVVALAVFVARRSEPVVPRPTVVVRSVDARLPAPAVAASRPGRSDAESTPSRSAVRAQAERRVARRSEPIVVAASLDADGTDGVAPLERIAPIAVAPIVESNIAPADIAVRPLSTITEMQIAPLTPPDRR